MAARNLLLYFVNQQSSAVFRLARPRGHSDQTGSKFSGICLDELLILTWSAAPIGQTKPAQLRNSNGKAQPPRGQAEANRCTNS
jgi:hypothetical protein